MFHYDGQSSALPFCSYCSEELLQPESDSPFKVGIQGTFYCKQPFRLRNSSFQQDYLHAAYILKQIWAFPFFPALCIGVFGLCRCVSFIRDCACLSAVLSRCWVTIAFFSFGDLEIRGIISSQGPPSRVRGRQINQGPNITICLCVFLCSPPCLGTGLYPKSH